MEGGAEQMKKNWDSCIDPSGLGDKVEGREEQNLRIYFEGRVK